MFTLPSLFPSFSNPGLQPVACTTPIQCGFFPFCLSLETPLQIHSELSVTDAQVSW